MARRRGEHERVDGGTAGFTLALVCTPGGDFVEDHVHRILQQMNHVTRQPFKALVINQSELPGWWAKIGLFQPGLFTGRVLYLDLDVTVLKSLKPLVDFPAPFAALRDPKGDRLNSSVMVWDAGAADHIYENFKPEVMDRLNGDQQWITEQMPAAWTFPDGWCLSFKHHCRHLLRPPRAAKVVYFHGKPRPWELGKEHWAHG